MTVAELMEKLSKMPRDLPVLTSGFGTTSTIDNCFLFDERFDSFDAKLGDIPMVLLELE